MNIEFHYYITKYLAVNAGFSPDEAEIIAHSSQFVDDNIKQFFITMPDNKSEYHNYISQTKDITKPKKELLRIYVLFHFFPGDPSYYKATRRDGKMHLMLTTPGSTHAVEVFLSLADVTNLYLIGIASHMLADTYSHQNFTGTFDEINAMKGVWEELIPNIGHADALYKPDIPNLNWTDPRLIDENMHIENKTRVLHAAKLLYNNFLFLTSGTNNWNKVKKNLNKILSDEIDETELHKVHNQVKERIEKYKVLLEEEDAPSDYDASQWLNSAVDRDIKFLDDRTFSLDPIKDKLTFKEDYQDSHWFKFQESVKKYQKMAFKKYEALFVQLELRNW